MNTAPQARHVRRLLVVLLLGCVAACSTVPERNAELERARATIEGVKASVELSPDARAEMQRAIEALRCAVSLNVVGFSRLSARLR